MSDRDWSLILILLGYGALMIGAYHAVQVFGWTLLAVGVLGNLGARR